MMQVHSNELKVLHSLLLKRLEEQKARVAGLEKLTKYLEKASEE